MKTQRFDDTRRAFFPTAASLLVAAIAATTRLAGQAPLSLPDPLYTSNSEERNLKPQISGTSSRARVVNTAKSELRSPIRDSADAPE